MQNYFLKRVLFLSSCIICWAGGLRAAPQKQPNVILIYTDDVGFGDVGAYGSKLIPTPNIDRLAQSGLRFTDAHSTASTCTPSRFSVLTGIHAFRYGAHVLPPGAPLIIPLDRITLPKLFKQAGYHTAVIGKWHLGLGKRGVKTDWNGAVAPGPLEVGFDDAFLLPYTNDRVPCVYLKNHHVVNLDPSDPLYIGSYKSVQKPGSTLYPDGRKNPEAMTFYKSTHAHNNSVINGIGRIGYQSGGKSALWDDSTMTQVFVDHVREYIAQHRKEPFFLFYTPQNIHVPRVPAPRFRGKTTLGYRGDSMVELDWAVGEVLRAVEENGLTENTLIIFSSDNGPTFNDGYDDGTTVLCSNKDVDHGHDASGLWRGGKYQILEGGTRVPFIVSWPNHVKAGQSDALVSQVDLLASFAAMLHISLPKESAGDSRNMLDTFLGKSAQGLPFMIEESRKLALRQGKWKYVQPAHPGWPPHRPPVERGLYNLQNDPLETNNLISAYPEKAQAMEAFLCALEKAPSIREQKGAAPPSNQ